MVDVVVFVDSPIFDLVILNSTFFYLSKSDTLFFLLFNTIKVGDSENKPTPTDGFTICARVITSLLVYVIFA